MTKRKKYVDLPVDASTHNMMLQLGWIQKKAGYWYLTDLGHDCLMKFCEEKEPESEIRPEFLAKD